MPCTDRRWALPTKDDRPCHLGGRFRSVRFDQEVLAMAGVDLYWIPLGAGARVVKASGRLYEALTAAAQHRRRSDLYHAALIAHTGIDTVTIEMTPIPRNGSPSTRGVVASGAVGTRGAGRMRVFRYEIRRTVNGTIPDLAYAVASPQRVTGNPESTARLLELVPRVPTPTWGRDELATGEMWNSNSVVAWILASADVDLEVVRLPPGGRAPGWNAGITIAARVQPVEAV